MSASRLVDLPVLPDPPTATAAQMAEADRTATTAFGIPLEALMENAARQVAAATRLFLGGADGADVVALAGTGHNGGDALAALRHLRGWGARVEAFVAGPRDRLRPLALLQHDILARLGVAVHETAPLDDRRLVERLRAADVVLDGLLGYSVSGAPHGEIARLVTLADGRRVVAVDLPSGLHPDTGATLGATASGAIHAALTVTLALPKAGLVRAEAREWVGELVLADIGIPAEAYGASGPDAHAVFVAGDLLRIIR